MSQTYIIRWGGPNGESHFHRKLEELRKNAINLGPSKGFIGKNFILLCTNLIIPTQIMERYHVLLARLEDRLNRPPAPERAHFSYACADGLEITYSSRAVNSCINWGQKRTPASGIICFRDVTLQKWLVFASASGVRFWRDVGSVIRASDGVRTVILPKTVKSVEKGAFSRISSLKSILLDENLEKIDKDAFYESELRKISLRKGLKSLEKSTFCRCKNLKSVFVEDACPVDVRRFVSVRTTILPPENTAVQKTSVWTLRALKNLVLPNGLERVGDYWFEGAGSQSAFASFDASAQLWHLFSSRFQTGLSAYRHAQEAHISSTEASAHLWTHLFWAGSQSGFWLIPSSLQVMHRGGWTQLSTSTEHLAVHLRVFGS